MNAIVRLGKWLQRVGSRTPSLSKDEQIDQLIAINHTLRKKVDALAKQVGVATTKLSGMERRLVELENGLYRLGAKVANGGN